MPDCLVSLKFFEAEGPNWQLSFKSKCKNLGWSFCPLRCWINSHALTLCVTVQTKRCFQGWGICSDSWEVWKSVKGKRKHSCYSNLQGNTRHSLNMWISEKTWEKIFSADWWLKGTWTWKQGKCLKVVWENVSHPRSKLCQAQHSKFNSTIKLTLSLGLLCTGKLQLGAEFEVGEEEVFSLQLFHHVEMPEIAISSHALSPAVQTRRVFPREMQGKVSRYTWSTGFHDMSARYTSMLRQYQSRYFEQKQCLNKISTFTGFLSLTTGLYSIENKWSPS